MFLKTKEKKICVINVLLLYLHVTYAITNPDEHTLKFDACSWRLTSRSIRCLLMLCSPEEYWALAPHYLDSNYVQSGSLSQGICTGDQDRGAFTQAVWQQAINTYGGWGYPLPMWMLLLFMIPLNIRPSSLQWWQRHL